MPYDVYSSIKNLVASGRFVLDETKAKINTLWVEGTLSDTERAELLALADANYDPAYSPLSPTEKALQDRIIALEQTIAQITPQ